MEAIGNDKDVLAGARGDGKDSGQWEGCPGMIGVIGRTHREGLGAMGRKCREGFGGMGRTHREGPSAMKDSGMGRIHREGLGAW